MLRHFLVIIREFHICALLRLRWDVVSLFVTPDQQTNNINKGLYMQPQIHTACTRDYNVKQILL